MTSLTLFAQSVSPETETIVNAVAAYQILVIAVPIMILLMLIMIFIMTIGVYGVQDRITEVRNLLENVFSKELDAIEDEQAKYKQSLESSTSPSKRFGLLAVLLISIALTLLIALIAILINFN